MLSEFLLQIVVELFLGERRSKVGSVYDLSTLARQWGSISTVDWADAFATFVCSWVFEMYVLSIASEPSSICP
jgi:hypothetical protein